MKRFIAAVSLLTLLAAPPLARAVDRLPGSLAPGAPRSGDLALDMGGGAGDGGAANVALSALYGGLAGALVGAGIGLIEGGNYGRDIAIGAGVGVVAGATWGVVSGTQNRDQRLASDGMSSPDRDPVMNGHAAGIVAEF
ncbi:hypothetical protein [Anaeromyxobacter paludicola]|uniref:Glycine zipper domain-containing protein n=1 Tax=Anaeromyxobacter paludicola TaxID=2918171 RepID=A0ABN6NBQ8_9BACT|nr:hypothetical protein [Anaeromyxobacter paludicola]BDG10689.1 hypothetical protein AMPC_38020 [Anaeromyxobacter paludicola]